MDSNLFLKAVCAILKKVLITVTTMTVFVFNFGSNASELKFFSH